MHMKIVYNGGDVYTDLLICNEISFLELNIFKHLFKNLYYV